MEEKEKRELCKRFFDELSHALYSSYRKVGSCNKDFSAYLVPKGTEHQISYSGKPENSFRISDHWNWYSNIKKCPDENYVQCDSLAVPKAKNRIAPGKASNPISAIQVAFFCKGSYYAVYGEYYNFQAEAWEWLDMNAKKVAEILQSAPETLRTICPGQRN